MIGRAPGSGVGSAVLIGASIVGVPAPPVEQEPPARDPLPLAHNVVAFALAPSPATAARLPFAERVRLGLGPELVTTLEGPALVEADTWLLEEQAFRGYLGPFSALRLLRHQVDDTGSTAIGPDGAFEVSSGPHPHCASPPVSAPAGYHRHHRVSLQPSRASYDTCLMWFSVDLFLTDSGRIEAVTLDLWEP